MLYILSRGTKLWIYETTQIIHRTNLKVGKFLRKFHQTLSGGGGSNYSYIIDEWPCPLKQGQFFKVVTVYLQILTGRGGRVV